MAYFAAHVDDFNSSLKGYKSASYNQNCCQSLRKKYILHKIKQIFCVILKSMGFGVRKSQLGVKMLIERADIIDWRWNNILLKWSGLMTTTYSKSNGKVMGILAYVNWEHGLIWLTVGSPGNFLPGAELVYKVGCIAGSCYGHMKLQF